MFTYACSGWHHFECLFILWLFPQLFGLVVIKFFDKQKLALLEKGDNFLEQVCGKKVCGKKVFSKEGTKSLPLSKGSYLRPCLYGLGYLRQPSPQVTLGELTFY